MKKIINLSMILFLSLVSCKTNIIETNLVTLHFGDGSIDNRNTMVLTYEEFENLNEYPALDGHNFCAYYYDEFFEKIFYKENISNKKSIDLYARYVKDIFDYEVKKDETTNSDYIVINGIKEDAEIEEELFVPECIEYTKISEIASNGLSDIDVEKLTLDGIKTIRESAFDDSRIGYMKISKEIENIEDGAFKNIKYLYKVNFEDNPYYSATNNLILKKLEGRQRVIIGYYNEYWNSMFNEQYLDGIEIVDIAPHSFSNIYSIEDIESVKDENEKPILDENGNIIYKKVPEGFSLYIPSSLTSISDRAFENCKAYRFNKETKEEVEIQLGTYFFRTLKEVKDYAFANSSITLLKYETRIEDNVILPFGEGVESFGQGAFLNTNFVNITIPKSLKTIGVDCFKGCNELKNIYYEGTEEEFENIEIASGNEMFTNAKVYYFSTEYKENGWYYYGGKDHKSIPKPILYAKV